MILRLLRNVAFVASGLTLISWSLLQVNAVQDWGKTKLEKLLSDETYAVKIGSFHGLAPFYFGCDKVAILQNGEAFVSIESLDLIPSWFEIFFGKISLAHLSLHGVDLTKCKPSSSKESSISLPQRTISLYSYRISQISLPQHTFDPILASRFDNGEVDCYLQANGSFFWHASNEHLTCRLTLKPYADTLTFATLDTKLDATASKTAISALFSATKMPQGSVFISLPCDALRLKCDLVASTDHLLQAFLEGSNSFASPLLSGKWEASGLVRSEAHTTLSPTVRFLASGNLEATNLSKLSFATRDLSCQKIESVFFSKRSKNERANQEYLLIASIDEEEPSSLTSISNLPTPEMIQGNVTVGQETLHLQAKVSSFVIGEQKISSCDLALTSTPFENGCKGTLEAFVNFDFGKKQLPVSFNCDYRSAGATAWEFPKVQINANDYVVAGALKFSLFPFVMRGKLESLSQDAAGLFAPFSLKVKKASCLLSFDPETENDVADLSQKALLHVELQDVRSDELYCKEAILHLLEKGPLDTPNLELLFAAKKCESAKTTLDALSFWTKADLASDAKSAPYEIKLNGTSKNGPLQLDVKGNYWSQFFKVDSLLAKSAEKSVSIASPIELLLHPASLELKPFEIACDTGGRLFGRAIFAPTSTNFSLTAEQFPLEFFEPLYGDLSIFGPVSGTIELAGTPKQPTLHSTFVSSNLFLWNPKTKEAPPLNASLEIACANGQANLFAEVQGLSLRKPTIVNLQLPLQFSLHPFCLEPQKAGKITGIFDAEFDLNTLLSSYFDEDEILEGIVSLQAAITGPGHCPQLDGTISWTDGKLFIPPIGGTFHNIQTTGTIQGTQVSFDKIMASDGANGTLVGSAKVTDLFNRQLHYEVEATAKDFAAIGLDEAYASGTGSLKLAGGIKEATLSGDIEVSNATLNLSKELSNDFPKLDITYVSKQTEVPFQKPTPFHFHLDLALNLTEGSIRGMGLESDWKGKTRLTGVNSSLNLIGCMVLRSGSLNFAGKQFSLTQGTVDFQGDILTKSKLQVIATNDVGSISTQVVLQGPLESPRIVLQSSPAMTQKEILSWILFNKSSSEITPMQGIQLGQTALKLNGKGDSFDILEKIKQKLHLDRIDFGVSQTVGPPVNESAGPQENIPNEVSVQVGKYISEGVIVTLSKDVTNEANRVGIEANLAKNITAQANVGDDQEAELSLEWKVKY